MPIYEYICQACGKQVEILQKISDPLATQCPHCHAEKLQKTVSASSFHLKGSGWYVTDFRDKKSQSPTKSDTTEGAANKEPAKDNKAETKKETKTDKE